MRHSLIFKSMKRFFICCFLYCCTSFTALFAQVFSDKINLQDSTQVHILETKWGDRLIGRIVKIENTQLTFQLNEKSKLTYQFAEIKSVGVYGIDEFEDLERPATGDKGTAWGPENLIYSSTAFNYPKRTGEVRNIELLLTTFDYGATDNFSIGGGIVVPVAIVVRGKLTTEISKNFHLGVGLNNVLPVIDSDPVIIAHGFLAGTLGTRENFINATAGYGFTFGDFGDSSFILSFGGSLSLSKHWRFTVDALWVTESGDQGLVPGFMMGWSKGKTRLEFGTAVLPDSDVPFIPILALGVRIAK